MTTTAEFPDGSSLTVDPADPFAPIVDDAGLETSSAARAAEVWRSREGTSLWPIAQSRGEFDPEHIGRYLQSFDGVQVRPDPPPLESDPDLIY